MHIVPKSLQYICTEIVINDVEFRHLGVSVGGRLLSNLCCADDTALCASNHHEADELIN